MNNILKKTVKTVVTQVQARGFYYMLLMNINHLIGIARGLWFKAIYIKNINSTIYSLESKSKIEIFNKKVSVNIGRFVFIRKNASIRLDFKGELNIGDKVFINDNCNINCVNKVSIGENTKIAPNVCINDHDHNYKYNSDEHLLVGEVVIGKNVWIGSNVVILRDTFIGDNVVIAAGSIVKGNVPSDTLFLNERKTRFVSILNKNKPLSS